MIQVALYEPEIPPNTGNIGRLCVGFNIPLILIEPLGFSITDRTLKRAGLDYWNALQLTHAANMEQFMSYLKTKEGNSLFSVANGASSSHYAACRVVSISKFGKDSIYEWSFQAGDVILMGNETRGIPHAVTEKYAIKRLHIPMSNNIRSYNLANATAICIAEAYRQLRWPLKAS